MDSSSHELLSGRFENITKGLTYLKPDHTRSYSCFTESVVSLLETTFSLLVEK